MVSSVPHPYLSPQDYLDWEPLQALRYEYIEGEVYAMAGGTLPHSEIAVNLTTLLKNHLRGKGCRVLGSDAKLGVTDSGPFFYADGSVTCDSRDRGSLKFCRYPCLVAEVLSPGTEAYDRGGKFAQYRRMESLQEYVLISSDRITVEIFRLNERGKWELTPYAQGETIQLSSVELEFPIEQLYEEVELAELPNADRAAKDPID